MNKKPKKSKEDTVTRTEINKLISEIDATNLILVRALQVLSLDIDNLKKEHYELHKQLILGPTKPNNKNN